jgi:predicted MFS family arabinose efflux permease
MSDAPEALLRSERAVLLLLAAVQFVNIVDFMMVMPLGPDFARDLGIDTAKLGVIGGAYTASAAVAGVLGSTVLDRFDRRTALMVANIGLAFGTLMGAFATDLNSLLAARVLAGFFGGPATAVAYAIVTDLIPISRRGRAMGMIMGAFSIASVLGVPAGLELARFGGWRTPFVVLAAAGLLVAVVGRVLLPSLRGHLQRVGPALDMAALFSRPVVIGALILNLLGHLARFSIIPFISPFVLINMGLPRSELGVLYMVGGVSSLITLRVMGPLVDRLGVSRVFAAGSLGVVLTTGVAFVPVPGWLPPLALFPLFMASTSAANVAQQTLCTAVPGPAERARYQSAQSALQHMGAALGASIGTAILSSDPDNGGSLIGMPTLAMFSMTICMLLPPLAVWVKTSLAAQPEPLRRVGG